MWQAIGPGDIYDKKIKSWVRSDKPRPQLYALPSTEEVPVVPSAENYILDVGQIFRSKPEHVPAGQCWSVAVRDREDWRWKHVFEDIGTHPETVEAYVNTDSEDEATDETYGETVYVQHLTQTPPQTTSRQPTQTRRPFFRRQEARWLSRHGRHCALLCGWDGSAPEVQPMFRYDIFANSYTTYLAKAHEGKLELLPDLPHQDVSGSPSLPKPGDDGWLRYKRDNHMGNVTVYATEINTEQMIYGAESSDEDEEDATETGGLGQPVRL